MANATEDIKKRLAQLRQEVPTRGMERHISTVGSVSELPAELQSPVLTSLTANESIQLIVYFPQQLQHGWNYVPKQALIFIASGVIHVLASIWPAHEPQISHIRQNSLMYMRISLLLLYGRIEIVAREQDSPALLDMEFNTVGWYRLSAPLRKLLQATKDVPGVVGDPTFYDPAAEQAVERLPIKFSNGVKIYALLPGEKLEELVFQPRTWKKKYLLFHEPVTPNTLLLLTSNFVAVIQEDLRIAQGWIITHIPRGNITAMTGQSHGTWCTLISQMKPEDPSTHWELLLTQEAVDAWRGVWIRHGGQWQMGDITPSR